jgi:hypothetical protein
MSRTEKSDAIRDAFLAALREQGAPVERVSELATNELNDKIRRMLLVLGGAGREVYLVKGVGLVNVHVRAEPPGWWGIMKSVKDQFDLVVKELGLKAYYVLLVPRKDHQITGYVVTDFLSSPFVQVPAGEKTMYTVKVERHLDPLKRLVSVERIAAALLQAGERLTSNA